MKTDLKYEKYKEYELLWEGKEEFDKSFEYKFEGLTTISAKESYSHRFKFKNGYGASVVKHWGSYGFEDDLFELAVLKFDKKNGIGSLCYDTEITDDVIGYLNNDEVLELLEKIKNLESDKNGNNI